MDLRLLGPVEATLEGRPVPLGATKQRAVLALLALNANTTVSVDRLVDGVWGPDPPPTARKMVQLYVSQLRRLLAAGGDAQIVTHGPGYELRIREQAVDALRFERLVERAETVDGATNGAAREALALWHGEALADIAHEPFARAESRRLDDLRLRAVELAVDADLAAGRHQEVLAQLERLIEAHPLRERLHAQRMLALYRSGRQAEALSAYLQARRRLLDEVGIEPSDELRQLHERILRQDPALRQLPPAPADGERSSAAPPASGGRVHAAAQLARLVLATVTVLLVGIAVSALLRMTGEQALGGIAEGSIGMIDTESAALEDQVMIGTESHAAVTGAGSVWVLSARQGTVARIDAGGERITTIDVGPAPTALAFGAGSLWVASGDDGTVAQVDPAANRVVQRIPGGNGLRAVAVGHGAVWTAAALDGVVGRTDLRSAPAVEAIAVGGHPAALVASPDAIWAAAEESGIVARIDARTGEVVDAIAVGNAPSALAAGFGAVWVANREDGTVSRIDPRTDRVTDTIPAGRAPVALVAAGGALWVADARGAVLRLDPRTRTITDTVRTGASPTGLAAARPGVWVTTAEPLAAHRGGTLRVGSPSIDLDPVFGGFLPDARPFTELVYEGLVGYRRADGAAGAKLVGALAVDVPAATADSRKYVFRLRRGVRFSTGVGVRADDFRRSMERALVGAPEAAGRFDAIEGAARCRAAPRRCDLSRGIVTDERARTVTIHLRRPDPELLQNLTLVAVVPPGTPHRRLSAGAPAGTGPYRVARFVSGQRVVLERNDLFRPLGRDGRPAGFADRIAVTFGGEGAQIAATEQGRLDVVSPYATITSRKLAALRTRIGSRLQSGRFAMTVLAWLNVEAPPFDDPRVRRAVNLAVDRSRAVDALGGREAGSPTCQLLPAGLPGHRPTCPFTADPSPAGAWTAPDEAQARRLVAAAGSRGTPVEVWAHPYLRRVGRHLTDVLADLGFRSRLRVFDDLERIYAAAVNPRRRPQIGLTGWVADFPDPAGVIPQLVSCGAYAPRDPASTNLSRFCDRGIDAAIRRASAGPAGREPWQSVERRVADAAPAVPLVNPRWVVVTSPRVGNVQFHPVSGMLLDHMWVR